MKKLVKIIALLLLLSMGVSVFASCDKDEDPEIPDSGDVETVKVYWQDSTRELKVEEIEKGSLAISWIPTSSGKTFQGWYKEASLKTPFDFSVGIDKDTKIYAKFRVDEVVVPSYSITYVLNGGTQHTANPETYTGSMNINLEQPEKQGYFFGGWYSNADFTGEAVTYIAKGSAENITLYAKWNEEIDITDTFKWQNSYACNAVTGGQSSSGVFKISVFVDISEYAGYSIRITLPAYRPSSGTQAQFGCIITNDKKQVVASEQFRLTEAGENTVDVIELIIPENAKYFRTTYYMDNQTSAYTPINEYNGQFHAGIVHSKAKYPVNFNVTQDDEICDYYAIKADGAILKLAGYGCTSYLALNGADKITVSMVASPQPRCGLAFYDANKQFISYVSSPESVATKRMMVEIEVPQSAAYFRTSYFNYENRRFYGEFSYTLENNGQVQDMSGKRAYQDGYIYFSREVSQTLDTEDTSNVKVTTGVLALPKSYSATGEKTKLIIYFHGNSHYVYYGKWGNTDDFRTQKQHFLDKGYAVLDCNGARDADEQKGFASAGSPQFVDGYYQCYKYAIENYNIDENVFVLGGSAGGHASINFVRWHQDNVRALLLASTWTDLKACHWGQSSVSNKSFVEYLGFNNETTYETEKTRLYDPALMIKTRADGVTEYIDEITVPVYGMIGSTETSAAYYKPFMRWMNAIMEGNSNAKLKVWDGKTHVEVVSGGVLEIDDDMCDFFDSITAN